ncbi:hypothetical protein TRVL_05615 [Trypanosoma vivax]|nr:hypothetical protein TRVL_05615 [Trypanosoma vivax]
MERRWQPSAAVDDNEEQALPSTQDGLVTGAFFDEGVGLVGEWATDSREDSALHGPRGSVDGHASNAGDAQHSLKSLEEFHGWRYDRFLYAYFGYKTARRRQCAMLAAQLCKIGVSLGRRPGNNPGIVCASRRLHRHSVLAVEGDAFFCRVVLHSKKLYGSSAELPTYPREWPNVRCVALHYGVPPQDVKRKKEFPLATLLVLMSSTSISKGCALRLCLHSYDRCLDEARWYEQLYGSHCVNEAGDTVSITRGIKRFDAWPEGLHFYHGVGQRHASAEPEAGFPFTLLDLKCTPEIGDGQLGIFAEHPIPYGMCFPYCGPTVPMEVVERSREHKRRHDFLASFYRPQPSRCLLYGGTGGDSKAGRQAREEECTMPSSLSLDDWTYAFGLGKHGMCFGQGLMRYVNHRYNLSKFGNIELCSVMLSVPSEFSPFKGFVEQYFSDVLGKESRQSRKKGKSRNGCAQQRSNAGSAVRRGKWRFSTNPRYFRESEGHFVIIPFFITTTDIEPGQQLLSWSYGAEYDAQLEREVVCDGHLVPFVYSSLLDSRQPLGRWESYKGDYRHSIAVGDIVWCHQCSLLSSKDPVDNLFVVVDVQAEGMGYVLLRRTLRLDALGPLLQNESRVFGGQTVVFGVCRARSLDHCFVAHRDDIVPLISDTDYLALEMDALPAVASLRKGCPCCAGISCTCRVVLVNVAGLRRATQLVVDGTRDCENASHLFLGWIWRLLKGEDRAAK